ncbi:MAG: PEP-CTERM sorting domain-containing protein [Verrucomicrobiota bacterium]
MALLTISASHGQFILSNPGFEDTTGATFNEVLETVSPAHSLHRTGPIVGWDPDELAALPGTGTFLVDGRPATNAFAGDYFGYAIGSGGNPHCLVVVGTQSAGGEAGLFAIDANDPVTISFEAAPFRAGGPQGDVDDLSFISVEAVYFNALGNQEATDVIFAGRLNAASTSWADLNWDSYSFSGIAPNDPDIAFARFFVSVNTDIAGAAFDNFAIIPEPSSLVLLLLTGLASLRRRR